MELSQIQSLSERVLSAQSKSLNEANIKTSLVLPFLQAAEAEAARSALPFIQ